MYGGLFDFFVGLLKPLFPVYDAVFGVFFKFMGVKAASIMSLGLLSATVAFIISLFYVILIDKEEYNRIRERQKELQDKMKEAQENDNMEKANKFMKESMSMQKKFMKASFKPMIASMFVFFLFVPWILTTFVPVVQAQQVEPGVYRGTMEFQGLGEVGQVEVRQNNDTRTVFFKGEEVEMGGKVQEGGFQWLLDGLKIQEDTANVKLSYSFVTMPFGIPLIGSSLEWLAMYILFQLPFTFTFRKLLGVQ